MPSVYLAHAVAGTAHVHLARTRRWARWVRRSAADAVVVAPWLYQVHAFGDFANTTSELREDARRRCITAAQLCDEVWLVGGPVTEDMRAQGHGAQVLRDFSDLGKEPPEARS